MTKRDPPHFLPHKNDRLLTYPVSNAEMSKKVETVNDGVAYASFRHFVT